MGFLTPVWNKFLMSICVNNKYFQAFATVGQVVSQGCLVQGFVTLVYSWFQ